MSKSLSATKKKIPQEIKGTIWLWRYTNLSEYEKQKLFFFLRVSPKMFGKV